MGWLILASSDISVVAEPEACYHLAMPSITGEIIEIGLGGVAWLALAESALPRPGQYMHAWSPLDLGAPLAECLYPGGLPPTMAMSELQAGESLAIFQVAPPVPAHWGVGTTLKLRGPLGQGFNLPPRVRRLALIALSGAVDRLLPLVGALDLQETAVALFTDGELPSLPLAIEAYPLAALPENITWPDFMALDLAPDSLPGLRRWLGLEPDATLGCPAQALVAVPMPCAALGECGACAVPGRHSSFLACKDGPIFHLNRLDF
jgi:hypothetical protein